MTYCTNAVNRLNPDPVLQASKQQLCAKQTHTLPQDPLHKSLL